MKLSVIIPVLNEAGCIGKCLSGLQELRRAGHEVVVVDGGSIDETVNIALPLCDKLLGSPKGRARQMNTGAAAAAGDIYIFLHADTSFACNPVAALGRKYRDDTWGCFALRLSGSHPLFRLFSFFINLRARLTGIVSGDQTMFINRLMFERVGGFPDIPLMEDIAISKRLRRYSLPVCLGYPVVSSSRRWEKYGIIKTMSRMWLRRFRYALGTRPEVLAKDYE